MGLRKQRCLIACLVLLLFNLSIASKSSGAQQSPLPPTATPEEVRVYEAFRAWITTQPRDVQQALMRVVIHPARDWVGGKGQNQSGDGMVDFGVAANGRDSRMCHVHRDVPVWSWSARTSEQETTA